MKVLKILKRGKDATRACYNCENYSKIKKVFYCLIDNIARKHNCPCVYLNKFQFKEHK